MEGQVREGPAGTTVCEEREKSCYVSGGTERIGGSNYGLGGGGGLL